MRETASAPTPSPRRALCVPGRASFLAASMCLRESPRPGAQGLGASAWVSSLKIAAHVSGRTCAFCLVRINVSDRCPHPGERKEGDGQGRCRSGAVNAVGAFTSTRDRKLTPMSCLSQSSPHLLARENSPTVPGKGLATSERPPACPLMRGGDKPGMGLAHLHGRCPVCPSPSRLRGGCCPSPEAGSPWDPISRCLIWISSHHFPCVFLGLEAILVLSLLF